MPPTKSKSAPTNVDTLTGELISTADIARTAVNVVLVDDKPILPEPSDVEAILAGDNAAEYWKPGGAQMFIDLAARFVEGNPVDPKTEAGFALSKTLGSKLASFKVATDKARKVYTNKLQAAIRPATDEGLRVIEEIQKLQDQVQEPIKAERARVKAIEGAIQAIRDLADLDGTETQEDLQERMSDLGGTADGQYEEFHEEAMKAFDVALKRLSTALQARIQYDDGQIAIAKVKAMEEAEAQRLREEAIRREAAEQATREAEGRAERQRIEAIQAAEREKQAAIDAERRKTEEAERQAADAKYRAEQEVAAANAAQLRAEQEASRAAEYEAERTAAREQQEAADTAAREANEAHRNRVHRAILDSLLAGGIPRECAINVGKLLAADKIANVKVIY